MFPDLGSRFGLVSNFRAQSLGSGVFVNFSKGSWDCTGHYGKSLGTGAGRGEKKNKMSQGVKPHLFGGEEREGLKKRRKCHKG